MQKKLLILSFLATLLISVSCAVNGTVSSTSSPPLGNGTVSGASPPPPFGNGTVSGASSPPPFGNGTVSGASSPPPFGNGTVSGASSPPPFGNGTVSGASSPPPFGNGTVSGASSPPPFGNGTVSGASPPPSGGSTMQTSTLAPNYNYADSSRSESDLEPVITNWFKAKKPMSLQYAAYLDVKRIEYSKKYVYVSCSGLPSYSIGPWPSNPNNASNQNFVFQFPRVPAEKRTNKTKVSLNVIGVLLNGVPLFNADDGQQIMGWSRNAYYFEVSSFDSCNGHPQQNGVYHHHLFPTCINSTLYNDTSSHSPIIGFANDGYPIYGPFGYSNATNPSSSIKRILPSYRLRSMTTRTTLLSGASVTGPSTSTYPLGAFLDDFEYVSGLGDVDSSGGRWCVTPEYPSGTYAYFFPTDSFGNTAYPYTLGLTYQGYIVESNSKTGKATISEQTTVYYDVDSSVAMLKSNSIIIAFVLAFISFYLF